jgi:Zn-dependent oligopeptidase
MGAMGADKDKAISQALRAIMNFSVVAKESIEEIERIINGIDQIKFKQIVNLVRETEDELFDHLSFLTEEEKGKIEEARQNLHAELTADLDSIIDSKSLCERRDSIINKIRGRNSSQLPLSLS